MWIKSFDIYGVIYDKADCLKFIRSELFLSYVRGKGNNDLPLRMII